jgi:hypothetical protein
LMAKEEDFSPSVLHTDSLAVVTWETKQSHINNKGQRSAIRVPPKVQNYIKMLWLSEEGYNQGVDGKHHTFSLKETECVFFAIMQETTMNVTGSSHPVKVWESI